MKRLDTGLTHTYTWALTFHKGGTSLGLYYKSDAAVIAEIIVCNRWVEWLLFHIPFGFSIWEKVLLWTSTKEVKVLSLTPTINQLKILAPEDEFLWNPDYVEEEGPSGTV